MMESNKTTLNTYQEKFDAYIAATPKNEFVHKWLDTVLGQVNKDSSILEIGSAFGREATYMQELGYMNVQATDAFDAAVNVLKDQGFADAKKFNALEDELDDDYELIFASAVFLHFTEREFESTLQKLHSHLGKSGLLAFTVKEGVGEEWSEAKMDAPRFFHYWQEEPLQETLRSCGYKVLDIVTNEEFSQKWLAVTCTPEHLEASK